MLHLIPAPLHRLALRAAYAVRRRFRMFAKPHLAGVSVLLEDDEGRIMLVRHNYGPEGWAMPGGGLKRGEDPAEAARREMREELGCELEALERLRVIDEVLGGCPHTAHVFRARPTSDPQVDNRELAELRWLAREGLGALPLVSVTRLRLRQLGYLA